MKSSIFEIHLNKKLLNEQLIQMDKRLLENFYLKKGYVVVNSSFAKLINKEEFELIYNIDAKEKFTSINLN